jgi:hypothetical protein
MAQRVEAEMSQGEATARDGEASDLTRRAGSEPPCQNRTVCLYTELDTCGA